MNNILSYLLIDWMFGWQKDGWMDGRVRGWVCGWKDGWIHDGWMDRRLAGWTNIGFLTFNTRFHLSLNI